MIKVNITKAIAINLTGYDREATPLQPGEHVVPASVGNWLDQNPGYGYRAESAEEPPAEEATDEATDAQANEDTAADQPPPDPEPERGRASKPSRSRKR